MSNINKNYEISDRYKKKIFKVVEEYISTMNDKDSSDMLIIKKNGILEKCSSNYQNSCENGPAIIYPDGSEEWMINENLHRLDGPAKIDKNGKMLWYIFGKQYNVFGEYLEKLEKMHMSKEHITKLKLQYGGK